MWFWEMGRLPLICLCRHATHSSLSLTIHIILFVKYTHTYTDDKHERTLCLFLQVGGRLQLGTIVVLAAVGVSPHFGGRGYLDTSVRVNTPTLAPLSMGGHVTLERDKKKGWAGLPGVLGNSLEGLMKLSGDRGWRCCPKTALSPHLAQHVSMTPTECS